MGKDCGLHHSGPPSFCVGRLGRSRSRTAIHDHGSYQVTLYGQLPSYLELDTGRRQEIKDLITGLSGKITAALGYTEMDRKAIHKR
jgi:hypothetical protein